MCSLHMCDVFNQNPPDSNVTTATTTTQPTVNDNNTVNVMEKQNDDTTVTAPCTRPLFTPVLSEVGTDRCR